MTPGLEELLKRAAKHKMTREEVNEQRISFVYGMLPANNKTTRDEVRRHLEEIYGPSQ